MNLNSTAIICAYNEQNTIANILDEVCQTNYFNEIIVFNDGSTDNTGELIKEFKKANNIIDIHSPKNEGKGFAMAIGAELAKCKYLVFIDADLSNFTAEHAKRLLDPVVKGNADMVLGQATKTLIPPGINPFKRLSGQRALKKIDILPILKKMKDAGFGVETLINMHFKANKKRVEYVHLNKLVHPTKFQKTKPHKAILEFIKEGFQIAATTFLYINMTIKTN